MVNCAKIISSSLRIHDLISIRNWFSDQKPWCCVGFFWVPVKSDGWNFLKVYFSFFFLFFSFLPHLHQVFHPVECSYCRCESMMGFRYRCQQCHNYQLCQNCFWRGHANGPHSNQHQMKEHSSWVIHVYLSCWHNHCCTNIFWKLKLFL